MSAYKPKSSKQKRQIYYKYLKRKHIYIYILYRTQATIAFMLRWLFLTPVILLFSPVIIIGWIFNDPFNNNGESDYDDC